MGLLQGHWANVLLVRGGQYHSFHQPGLSFRAQSLSCSCQYPVPFMKRSVGERLWMNEQTSPSSPLCLCSHHSSSHQSKGQKDPQKSPCPTACVTNEAQGGWVTGWRSHSKLEEAQVQKDDLFLPEIILRPHTVSVAWSRRVTLARTDESFLYWPPCCWVRCDLPRDKLRVASWAVGCLWIVRLIPPETWAPSRHLSSPGEESSSTKERMSGPCVEVAQMLPHLGCGGAKKAKCRDAGLLHDERARERLCLPWVAWEEGDPGGEPGRGQLTLSRWIPTYGRSQPGPCRGQQHGALSQGEARRERSEPWALPWAVPQLPKLSLLVSGSSECVGGPTWGGVCAQGGPKPRPHPGIYSNCLLWKSHFASQSRVSALAKNG